MSSRRPNPAISFALPPLPEHGCPPSGIGTMGSMPSLAGLSVNGKPEPKPVPAEPAPVEAGPYMLQTGPKGDYGVFTNLDYDTYLKLREENDDVYPLQPPPPGWNSGAEPTPAPEPEPPSRQSSRSSYSSSDGWTTNDDETNDDAKRMGMARRDSIASLSLRSRRASTSPWPKTTEELRKEIEELKVLLADWKDLAARQEEMNDNQDDTIKELVDRLNECEEQSQRMQEANQMTLYDDYVPPASWSDDPNVRDLSEGNLFDAQDESDKAYLKKKKYDADPEYDGASENSGLTAETNKDPDAEDPMPDTPKSYEVYDDYNMDRLDPSYDFNGSLDPETLVASGKQTPGGPIMLSASQDTPSRYRYGDWAKIEKRLSIIYVSSNEGENTGYSRYFPSHAILVLDSDMVEVHVDLVSSSARRALRRMPRVWRYP